METHQLKENQTTLFLIKSPCAILIRFLDCIKIDGHCKTAMETHHTSRMINNQILLLMKTTKVNGLFLFVCLCCFCFFDSVQLAPTELFQNHTVHKK